MASASGPTPVPGDVHLEVAPSEAGERLDVFVTRRLHELSRAQVQRLVRDGHITLDGSRCKVSVLVPAGGAVAVHVPPVEPPRLTPESLPLSILHEDRDVIVVDKPAGMVVHPAAGHAHGTLVNALLHHVTDLSGIGGSSRPGIVHRLDKGTSGVMVVAKHDRAHQALSRQFQDRTVHKDYLALVWGHPSAGTVFNQALGRDPRDRKKISSRAGRGRNAVTTVLNVEPLGPVSLIRLTIGTGRTHQIRVHLSEAGYPVVGDRLYGGVRARLSPTLSSLGHLDRPFLHACELSFAHPADGRMVTFSAPLPSELNRLVETLRRATRRDAVDHSGSQI